MGKRRLGLAHLLGWVVISAFGCGSSLEPAPDSGFSTTTTTTTGTGGFGAECEFGFGGGGSGGTGADTGFVPEDKVNSPTKSPPAISGGTLLVSADGNLAVAADPARDLIFFTAISSILEKKYEIQLEPGAEPGRLVEDAAGRVHVALRGTGELLTLDLATGDITDQRSVCDHPRGLAYEEATDSIHVACTEGRVVTMPAAGGDRTRSIRVADDLRDVVVRGDELWVSTFRSAKMFRISKDGEIVAQTSPAGLLAQQPPSCEEGPSDTDAPGFDPTVAWRVAPLGEDRVVMLHQRSLNTPLVLDEEENNEGYGSRDCLGIVQSVVSILDGESEPRAFPAIVSATLSVDVAASPNGARLAVAVPGSQNTAVLIDAADAEARAVNEGTQLTDDDQACLFSSEDLDVDGQATSVAFRSNSELLVLSREPARLYLFESGGDLIDRLSLSDIDVSDTGHDLFHHDLGHGIACASCHPEARDDGHVWNFDEVGPRRTQELRGGLLGTEPFHWDGSLAEFEDLVEEVMQRRMGGPFLTQDQTNALVGWLDVQPELLRSGLDANAIERGQAIFESEDAQCSVCHEGSLFTNNKNENVGTGEALQVPSLVGLSFRAPYMHDGCADTLEARFSDCGGGDAHGTTSQLSDDDLADLIVYLRSL